MAITPFEQANFNLLSFADTYNDIFDSTAKDVQIELKDSNGNIYTKTVANRGKFKQQLWDDVGGALGQFKRTFYVDATNGDDNNDGSNAHPFKTLKKACDSVPIGGYGSITLAQNQTHFIDSEIYLHNKYIAIFATNSIIENTAYVYTSNGTDYTATYGFAPVMSLIFFYKGTIRTANLLTDANGNVLPSTTLQGIVKRHDDVRAFVKTFSTDIELGDTDFIRRASGSNAVDLHMYSGSVNRVGANQDGYLISNEAGDFRFSAMYVSLGTERDGTTDLTWDSIISGIVKDANGVPRNIISNIVF